MQVLLVVMLRVIELILKENLSRYRSITCTVQRFLKFDPARFGQASLLFVGDINT